MGAWVCVFHTVACVFAMRIANGCTRISPSTQRSSCAEKRYCAKGYRLSESASFFKEKTKPAALDTSESEVSIVRRTDVFLGAVEKARLERFWVRDNERHFGRR